MVEGGASIIGSFLTEASSSLRSMPSKSIVDTVIITIAPTFVGDDGIGYGTGRAGDKVDHLPSSLSPQLISDCPPDAYAAPYQVRKYGDRHSRRCTVVFIMWKW